MEAVPETLSLAQWIARQWCPYTLQRCNVTEDNNALKITLEQTEDGEVISSLQLEYPVLDNLTANLMQLTLIEGMVATVRGWNESKYGWPADESEGSE